MATTICGNRRSEVSQRKLQSAVLGMIVVANAECEIDRISCQKRAWLETFGHVPAESIEDNLASQVSSEFPVLSSGGVEVETDLFKGKYSSPSTSKWKIKVEENSQETFRLD